MPTNGEKILSWFPQMREELDPITIQHASATAACALIFLQQNPILGFAFFTRYGFSREQLKAAMIVMAAVGKMDEYPS